MPPGNYAPTPESVLVAATDAARDAVGRRPYAPPVRRIDVGQVRVTLVPLGEAGRRLAACDHDCDALRAAALAELARDADVPPEDAPPVLGAMVPLVLRTETGLDVALRVCTALVAPLSATDVVVALDPADDAAVAHVATWIEGFRPSLQRHADGVGAAAAVVRFLCETGVRGPLEQLLYDDLRRADVDIATEGVPRSSTPEDVQTALVFQRALPRRAQRLRSALAALERPLRDADRERLSAWRVGLAWSRWDTDDVVGVADLRLGHGHVHAAVDLLREVRTALADVLVGSQVAAQALSGALADESNRRAEAGNQAIAVLAAATAGPTLLLGVWALDVFSGPWWAVLAASLVVAGVLVGVWSAVLHVMQGHPGHHRRHRLYGGAFVAALVGLGLVLPGQLSNDPANDDTRDAVEDIRNLNRRQIEQAAQAQQAQLQQLRLVRRELRATRRLLRAPDAGARP